MRSLWPGAWLAIVAVGTACGQCIGPGTETFQSGVVETAFGCNDPHTGVLPAGWMNDPGGQQLWTVGGAGGTGSTGTGPSGGCPDGTGRFAYVESSQSCITNARLVSPAFDASTVVNPTISFCYHLFGADCGTLHLEVFDGSGWSSAFSVTGDQGDQWFETMVPVTPFSGTACAAEVRFRFRYAYDGVGFLADCAIDEITFGEPTSAFPTNQEWELNDALLGIDVDGVLADPFFSGAITSLQTFACTPPVDSVVLSISNSTAGLAGVVLVFNDVPIVPAGGGGVLLADGQIVNLDLSAGLGFVGMNLPTFPGAQGVSVTVPIGFGVAGTTSIQGSAPDPGASTGLSLTQASQIDVTTSPSYSIPYDDSPLAIDVTQCPLDCPGGIDFYGTNFTQIHVSPNGRVLFGGGSISAGPTVLDAQTGFASASGFWTDLDPSLGGAVTVSSPATDVVRVQWLNVPHWGLPGTSNSFYIEFDATTDAVTFGALQGLDAGPTGAFAPDQLIGISPGALVAGGAADPGFTNFNPGQSGSGGPDEMLYRFNDVSLGTGLPPPINNGTNVIVFTPNVVGNYDYSAL